MIQMLLMAVWFGILTSVSPCPLATNIAAVSFLGKKISKSYIVLLNGVFYTIGRAIFYTAVGSFLAYFLNVIPKVSDFLQTKAAYIVGPIMVILGIVLLDVVKIKLPSFQMNVETQNKFDKIGFLGAFLLGFLFASMLCPVSAAFFFSNLIQSGGNFWVLFLYGIGTGLPVLFFAVILAFCAERISRLYQATTIFEKYARRLTAVIFISVGIYYILRSLL
ncbi:MAG: aromatic aminobenezylarsenical efflux permease ArsG family transporter [Acetobacter sp.]|nr:aromatic aminobenezylarsenical efflux permease ArsG family transporter [Acetobacter sp.]